MSRYWSLSKLSELCFKWLLLREKKHFKTYFVQDPQTFGIEKMYFTDTYLISATHHTSEKIQLKQSLLGEKAQRAELERKRRKRPNH